ncbi:MAG: cell envelope biogenesis protein TolA [Phenylobacterium zucineum]|nr:MAG: cell envelope biogenesis protein TolA [Phenylobacterium zucineum]
MARGSDLSPAMAGSVLLHLALAAVLVLLKPWAREIPRGATTPVTLMTTADLPDIRPAEAAPDPQTAQTETPVPGAPPQPAASTPLPKPVPPPEPEPKPKPIPAPIAPKPVPVKPPPPAKPSPSPPPKPATKSLNLDALAASVAKVGKASPVAKGPTRPETALQARDAAGAAKGLSAGALAGLADELQRRWNPNCEVEGGKDVRIRVTFTLGLAGQIVGKVEAGGQENSANPVIQTAAERAIRAVHQAAPFSTLPRDLFGQKVAVNFNAREACS